MAGRGRASTLPAWMTAAAPSGGSSISLQNDVTERHEDNKPQAALMSVMDHYAYSKMGATTIPAASNGDTYAKIDERPREERRGRSRSIDRERSQRGRSERDRRRDEVKEVRRSRSRDRRRRSRSRSRDKRRRSSSKSRAGGEAREAGGGEKESAAYKFWKSRKEARRLTNQRNFDIPPPPGSDGLPPQGFPISCMATLNINLVSNPLLTLGGLGTGGSLTSATANMQQTKHARRLYVGGIPPGTSEQEVTKFFNETITKATGGAEGPCPVISTYINNDKCFAFVELNSVELTTACCQFDGIEYKGAAGTAVVRIRRPNDFRQELLPASTRPIPTLQLDNFSVVGTTVVDGPNKVFVGNLPIFLGEEQVRELLEAFGPLRSFHLVKDLSTGLTKGYGFCDYMDPAITLKACEGLNGMEIGDKTIAVRVNPAFAAAAAVATGKEITRVLLLTSMVTAEDLTDEGEYKDIVDDIRLECSQYGNVSAVLIPRAIDGYPKQCEGNVYVEFSTKEMARTAGNALSGKKFAEQTVMVDYFDEEKFANRQLI